MGNNLYNVTPNSRDPRIQGQALLDIVWFKSEKDNHFEIRHLLII